MLLKYYTRQTKKVVQLQYANITQKTYRDIVDKNVHIFKAFPISNLLVGQTSQNIKLGVKWQATE